MNNVVAPYTCIYIISQLAVIISVMFIHMYIYTVDVHAMDQQIHVLHTTQPKLCWLTWETLNMYGGVLRT